MVERRAHPRVHVNARVRLYHPELGKLSGKMQDVSSGGMFIALEESLDKPLDHAGCDGRFHIEPAFMDVIFEMDCIRATSDGLVLVFAEQLEPELAVAYS